MGREIGCETATLKLVWLIHRAENDHKANMEHLIGAVLTTANPIVRMRLPWLSDSAGFMTVLDEVFRNKI